MATTTTNFGWDIPQSTDLVKDGATAIATLGQDIDTALVDLKGGTTGQVLAKASNTDLDFTWSSVDPLTILDAKGDLISATAADTPARLAVGANGTVLTADSAETTGLKWATVSAGSNWSLISSAALTGAGTITISGISGKNKLLVVIDNGSSASASTDFLIRLNSDSGANYYYWGLYFEIAAAYSANNFTPYRQSGDSRFRAGTFGASAALNGSCSLFVDGANTSGQKAISFMGGGGGNSTNSGQLLYAYQGYYGGTSTISSVSAISNVGNFDNGTLYVYGSDN